MSQINSIIADLYNSVSGITNRPTKATVISKDLTGVNLQFGQQPSLIRNVEVIGGIDSVAVGDEVTLIYKDDRPVVISSEASGVVSEETLVKYPADLRMTLASGDPESITSSGSTIYVNPYKGDRISLFVGQWKEFTLPVLPLSASGLGQNAVADAFVNAKSGSPQASYLAWASQTARATGLVWKNGVPVLATDPAYRYIGTFMTGTAGVVDFWYQRRNIWNMYNQISRPLAVPCAGGYHSYNSTVPRSWGNNGANYCTFVIGFYRELIPTVHGLQYASTTTGGLAATVAICINSLTPFAYARVYDTLWHEAHTEAIAGFNPGYNYLYVSEQTVNASTICYFNDAMLNCDFWC